MPDDVLAWPEADGELVEVQTRLAGRAVAALDEDPWTLPPEPVVGGCFVAFAHGEAGPGHPGDRAWAAAVAWRSGTVLAHAVAAQRVPAAYRPGLLARREGPVLEAAVTGLEQRPDVLLVDATGLDHPRRAGLALHLGAVTALPTVGVTHRPLAASGAFPELRRGAVSPLDLDGDRVGYWVCTRTGARPVAAHAGWRTSAATAVETVLAASTERARTPAPLREARRVAKTARAEAEQLGAGVTPPP